MQINKILFITLSNIGDVILTLPVLDYLRANFSDSKITVMVGPRAKEIFQNNPSIDRLIIYDKYSRLREKIRLFNQLKKEKFDLVIDLRNTLYGALLPVHYRTSPFLSVPHIQHMKERNLYRLARALKVRYPLPKEDKRSFYFTTRDKDYLDELLKKNGITAGDKIILVSAGTGGDTRRWEQDKFVKLCQHLSEDYKVLLVATKAHQSTTQYIYKNCPNKIYDFTGLTSLRQLSYLLTRSVLLITCDTGTLQLGSYLDIPIVALFGPSDEKRYGPRSSQYKVIKKDIFCRPCKEAQCRFGTTECMKLIKTEDVFRAARDILATEHRTPNTEHRNDFKRILIVRTDRIGDVLLSTPVIRALRDNYPFAYIAMMVAPYAKDIVDGNPYLDEVIIYDKDVKHSSWASSIRFALSLKKKRFDLAIVLHPVNRAHLLTFFAGIPRRIGYDRKFGVLLTDRIRHTKQLGQKHELEYNLDLVRYLGIQPQDKNLFMPIKPESEEWVEALFKQEGINKSHRLLAIHPGASCISRIWPADRYARVADRLVESKGFKIFILAGPQTLDLKAAEDVIKYMHHPVINLAGKISLSQLASLLKRCKLLISTDTGPMHIASAVGTPQVVIFGRNQPGLSPLRWGPTSKTHRILHKEVGCIECLAHNCVKDFACLKAVTVDDVVNTVDLILKLC
jgi:heptosyltransferase-2